MFLLDILTVPLTLDAMLSPQEARVQAMIYLCSGRRYVYVVADDHAKF